MTDLYPPSRQRPAIIAFAEALDSAPAALRRDECGDWRIAGNSGKVFPICGTVDRKSGPGFHIYVECRSTRAWTAAKAKLGFARLTNDGDTEGLLFLDRLPTADEAIAIRSACGIKKRRAYSEDTLAAMRARLPTGRQAPASGLPSELVEACA